MKVESYPFALFESQIVPIEQANISIMTNGLHYGIGIYGGMKVHELASGPAIFRIDDHLERMQKSVEILKFPYEFKTDEIKQKIINLAEKNNVQPGSYIRPIIYRSDLNLSPDIAGDYDIAVYMLKMPKYFDAQKGLSVCVSSWVRNSEDSIPPRTKATGGYINSALAINDAHLNGFDSAIMLDKRGNVSEGAVMNIFLVKDGKLITPSLDSDILEGITRRTVLELANEQGIEVEERTVSKDELFSADEIFFSGTAANVTWCREVDNQPISPQQGPITSQIVSLISNLAKSHPQLYTKIAA